MTWWHGQRDVILSFPKKGDLGIVKNYRAITLTSIAAKNYNVLLRNQLEPKTEKILRKNQNGLRRNRSMTSQILTTRWILEGVRVKKSRSNNIIRQLLQGIWLHTPMEDGANTSRLRPLERMQYKDTKVKVCSPDRDTDYFDRCAARRHISSTPVNYLPKLRA